MLGMTLPGDSEAAETGNETGQSEIAMQVWISFAEQRANIKLK